MWPYLQYNLNHVIVLLVTSWTEIMTSQPLLQNTFPLRRPKATNFSVFIKIASRNKIKMATMVTKTTFKDSKKVKRTKYYVLKCNLYLYLLFTIYVEVLHKLLTHFQPMFHFYNPWKHQKTSGFLLVFKGYRSGALVENGLKLKNHTGLLIPVLLKIKHNSAVA